MAAVSHDATNPKSQFSGRNLNSRLRITPPSSTGSPVSGLTVFLNHRTFMRSECPERVGKSPTQLMTGQPHAHWLELLGRAVSTPIPAPKIHLSLVASADKPSSFG